MQPYSVQWTVLSLMSDLSMAYLQALPSCEVVVTEKKKKNSHGII